MEIQKIFIIVIRVYLRNNFTILGSRSQYFFYLIDAYFHYTNSFASGEFIFSFNSCIKYIIGAGVHGEAAAGVVKLYDAKSMIFIININIPI